MNRHPRRRTDHRATRRDDERGSILIVLAFIVFTSLILTVVARDAVSQLGLGSTLVQRDNALQAATAGVQSVVAEIRGATTTPTSSAGVIDSLPCTAPTGSVPGSDGGATYTTSITYNLTSTTGGLPESSTCLSSGLPPHYIIDTATITSTGTAQGVQRELKSTYTFTTTYTPIPGGQILSYDNHDCLQAVADGGHYDLEVVTDCTTPAPADQTFMYNANWTLEMHLGGGAWCLQNPWETGSYVEGNAPPAELYPCTTTTGAAPHSQEWGINNSAPIQGVQSNGHEDSYCLDNPIASGTQSSPAETVTVQGCNGGFNQSQTWQMSQTVGAGDAAPTGSNFFGPTNQLVNFQQFGRCLDVNGQNVSYNDLIVYPCKQFPDPNEEPIWNQRWCWEPVPGATAPSSDASVGILYTPNPVYDNGSEQTCAPSGFSSSGTDSYTGNNNDTVTPYCLVPEGYSENTNGSWVSEPFVEPCNLSDWPPTSSNLAALERKDMLWNEWNQSAPSNFSYAYSVYSGDNAGLANSDDHGLCLTAGALGTASGGDQYSFAQMTACNGAWTEKWNAPPSYGVQPLSDTYQPLVSAGG